MPAARANSTTATLRQQVYERLRGAIEQGSLRAGTRLPPSREHAAALGVSRNTVLWAVQRLQAEGYVEARVGDGTYVSQAAGGATTRTQQQLVASPRGLSARGQLIADTAARWNPPVAVARAFRMGAPEVDTFPYAVWDRLARQAGPGQRAARAQYLDPAGDPQLREAVAQWLWASRGIRCDAGQVVVCSGSQQAIDLIARLLLDVGDEVLVEDPGYPGIRAALLGHGVLARPMAMDGEGACIAEATQRWPGAHMAVVTPTHQYPTGVRMGLARRQALLQWARTHDAWVVEDDYDGEFQYGAQRVPALCSLPGSTRGCAWASSWRRRRWCSPLPWRAPSPTGMHPAMRRRCWRSSLPRVTCCATCARCASCTRHASRRCAMRWPMPATAPCNWRPATEACTCCASARRAATTRPCAARPRRQG